MMEKYDGYDYTKDDEEIDYITAMTLCKNKQMRKVYEDYLKTLEDRVYLRNKPYKKG